MATKVTWLETVSNRVNLDCTVYKSLIRPRIFLGKLRTSCEEVFSTSNSFQNLRHAHEIMLSATWFELSSYPATPCDKKSRSTWPLALKAWIIETTLLGECSAFWGEPVKPQSEEEAICRISNLCRCLWSNITWAYRRLHNVCTFKTAARKRKCYHIRILVQARAREIEQESD